MDQNTKPGTRDACYSRDKEHGHASPEHRARGQQLLDLTEAAGHACPYRMQHLLSRARCDEQRMPDTAAGRAVGRLSAGQDGADAVLIVDETAGEKSPDSGKPTPMRYPMSRGIINALGPDRAAEAIMAGPLLAGESAAEVITQLGRLFDSQLRDIEAAGPADWFRPG